LSAKESEWENRSKEAFRAVQLRNVCEGEKMSKVILFGTGGGADTAYRLLTKDSPHEIVGYTVDADRRECDTFNGLPVVDFETVQEHFPPDQYKMFILLSFDGMNALRINKFEQAKAKGYTFVSYVASNIFRIEDIQVGENCLILENQTINLDAKIGDNVVMWSGNHLGDRSIIGDHVWISSQVAIGGDVQIGKGCFIGMHATIAHGISVAEKNFIGANTLITKKTKPGSVFVQTSNKPLPINSEEFAKII
jgi:sugar O-acyltransferase (sialic acid O-acetyltransferase NeuD family)